MATEESAGVPDAEVRAAAERWAAAAGVPASVAVGSAAARPPVAVRLLRGLVLGASLGALLLLIGSAAQALPLLAVLLAVAVVGARTAHRRRRVGARPWPDGPQFG